MFFPNSELQKQSRKAFKLVRMVGDRVPARITKGTSLTVIEVDKDFMNKVIYFCATYDYSVFHKNELYVLELNMTEDSMVEMEERTSLSREDALLIKDEIFKNINLFIAGRMYSDTEINNTKRVEAEDNIEKYKEIKCPQK